MKIRESILKEGIMKKQGLFSISQYAVLLKHELLTYIIQKLIR